MSNVLHSNITATSPILTTHNINCKFFHNKLCVLKMTLWKNELLCLLVTEEKYNIDWKFRSWNSLLYMPLSIKINWLLNIKARIITRQTLRSIQCIMNVLRIRSWTYTRVCEINFMLSSMMTWHAASSCIREHYNSQTTAAVFIS